MIFPNFNGLFNTAEEKSEEIFVKETSRIIDAYVSLEGRKLSFSTLPIDTVRKCEIEDDPNACKDVSVYKSDSTKTFQNIIASGLLNENDLINPSGKKKCNVDAGIEVFRDEDYVYCFKTSFECGSSPDISVHNIDTCNFDS